MAWSSWFRIACLPAYRWMSSLVCAFSSSCALRTNYYSDRKSEVKHQNFWAYPVVAKEHNEFFSVWPANLSTWLFVIMNKHCVRLLLCSTVRTFYDCNVFFIGSWLKEVCGCKWCSLLLNDTFYIAVLLIAASYEKYQNKSLV